VEIRAVVAAWEQGCCGERISVGGAVTWEIFARSAEDIAAVDRSASRDVRYVESHHESEPNGATVTGTVVHIRALGRSDGAGTEQPTGDIDTIAGATDFENERSAGLTFAPTEYVVTLAVSDDAVLPTVTE
jgi:hypothetical protein